MIDNFLEERAVLFVAGAMTPGEREEVEMLLEFNPELRILLHELQEIASAIAFSRAPAHGLPISPQLRSKVLQRIAAEARPSETGFVVTGPDRLVHWVNPEFTEMCGYSLDEVRGKKLGPLLQGKATDAAAISRMRAALDAEQAFRETTSNSHKDGSPYVVEIAITPIRDDEDRLRWFVARERLLEKLPA